MGRSKPKKSAKAAPAVRDVDAEAEWQSWLKPWMLVALVLALTAAARIRLLGIPLERDEGEFAYGGQLLLHGIPPYKFLYSMKFPGIYGAYAAMMAVFGQTIIGIHVGFMLVNAAAIVLVYLLGKRLLSAAAGVAACAAYALLSMGLDVNGTQAHATHFVVLAALGGTLLLLRGIETRRWPILLWSGVLYGIAILMKQHGALFAVFAGSYLALDCMIRRRSGWRAALRDVGALVCGVAIPLALTGLALWWAGVFGKFWFWTYTYASQYEQELHFSAGLDVLEFILPRVVGPNLLLWILALLGLFLVWWKKQDRAAAVFLVGLLIFSILAVCPGFYFRAHYFVLMLPAVALLAGAAVSVLQKQWPRLSWLPYSVFAAALAISITQQHEFLFQMTPLEITRAMYSESPFPEAVKIADYIHMHTSKGARIAVLGSEPEIPFYADRLSASGHIYMYGLMEPQPYAETMQEEFIQDIEKAQPDYVVLVMYRTSWMQITKISSYKILQWWAAYQPQRYQKLVGVAEIVSPTETKYQWDNIGAFNLQSPAVVLIYKRTDADELTKDGLSSAQVADTQKKLDMESQTIMQAFAIVLEPKNFNAYNNLGAIFYTEGQKEQAIAEFRRSLSINPDQARVHYYIGNIYLEMRQYSDAVDELTKALRLEPGNANAQNAMGVALFQMGDYENASALFGEEMRMNPADPGPKRNFEAAQAKMKMQRSQ